VIEGTAVYGSGGVCPLPYSNGGTSGEIIYAKTFNNANGQLGINIGTSYTGDYAVNKIFTHIEFVESIS
jgi:hypothetical protein